MQESGLPRVPTRGSIEAALALRRKRACSALPRVPTRGPIEATTPARASAWETCFPQVPTCGLTDNGIQFADLPRNRRGPTALLRDHPFERVCLRHGIEHRLTKPNHLWTNGQVERMNRTIKEATVRTYHSDGHEQLRQHLNCFLAAYNFGKRLKTLGGLTPCQFICSRWQKEPDRLISNPPHLSPGLNMESIVRIRHAVSPHPCIFFHIEYSLRLKSTYSGDRSLV